MATDDARKLAAWELVVECSAPVADERKLNELLVAVDWPRVLAAAEEHGLVGHVAARIAKQPDLAVPATIRTTLQDLYRTQTFSTMRMAAELFRLLGIFREAGIDAIVIKGPVLAAQAYGDPSVRSFGDLDLLVRDADIARATAVMVAAGYQAAVSLQAIAAGKIPGQYLFRGTEPKMVVELHNDRTLRYFPRPLPIEEFFGRRIFVSMDGRQVPALSVEDCLVLICIHGAKHFWERLMWVTDVASLIGRQGDLDWKRALQSAETVGATRMLMTALWLVEQIYGVALPAEIAQRMREDRVARQEAVGIAARMPDAAEKPISLRERALFRLRMRGGVLRSWGYLLRLSLATTEEDWGDAPGAKGRGLLERIRRPIRLARKHGRRSEE